MCLVLSLDELGFGNFQNSPSNETFSGEEGTDFLVFPVTDVKKLCVF